MKNLLLITGLHFACSSTLFAQFEGKKFLSGSAALGFHNNNTSQLESQNQYTVSISPEFGKFRSNNRASGIRLAATLTGGKEYYAFVNGNPVIRKGINGYGVEVGYFWQYYKHFGDKAGIFGGPGINLGFNGSRAYESGGEDVILEKLSKNATLYLGLNAGAYYALSGRWWLLGGIGFSTPVSLQYTHSTSRPISGGSGFNVKENQFTYNFTPAITLPSVSLGLRYFLK